MTSVAMQVKVTTRFSPSVMEDSPVILTSSGPSSVRKEKDGLDVDHLAVADIVIKIYISVSLIIWYHLIYQ